MRLIDTTVFKQEASVMQQMRAPGPVTKGYRNEFEKNPAKWYRQ